MQTEKTEKPEIIIRDYIVQLRHLQLNEAYITFDEDFTPELQAIISEIVHVEFNEKTMFQYYGQIKRAVTRFMGYWAESMNTSVLRADHMYNRDVSRDYLIKVIDESSNIERKKQTLFNTIFLPVKNKDEQDKYKEIIAKHHAYIETLNDMKKEVENYVRHSFDIEFLQKCALMSPKKSNEMFLFTHKFIAIYLSTILQKVRISVEEIHRRLVNNLGTLQIESKERHSILKTKMFEKQAEKYIAMKNEDLVALAELNDEISSLNKNLEPSSTMEHSLAELDTEIRYWRTKLEDLKVLTDNYNRIHETLEDAIREEQIHSNLETTELPGTKRDCFATIGVNMTERRLWLQPKFEATCKAIVTFFSVKGYDNEFYTDRFNTFYIDRYGHTVSMNQADEHHIDSKGNKLEVERERKYYRDENGRYVIDEDGRKLYQRGACASLYKMEDNSLLTKTDGSSQSGASKKHLATEVHSENMQPKTLSREDAAYLWEAFAGLLPRALGDVVDAAPKDPIHYLAHRLLKLKSNRNSEVVQKMVEEDKKFAFDIYKKRNEELEAARAAWRTRHPRRAGPADLDDLPARAALAASIADEQYALALALDNQ